MTTSVDAGSEPMLSSLQPLKKQFTLSTDENPEESGLIKCTPIESTASSNSAAMIPMDGTHPEEEKQLEVCPEETSGETSGDDLPLGTEARAGQSVSEIFKLRMTNYRKQLSRQMNFPDQICLRDPQLASEYAPEIYQNMRRTEARLKVSPTYLQ